MEFTGERYIPNTEDVEASYEDWHRYLYASALVADQTVLDVASGEGYGTHWLAQVARRVVGVDVDQAVVRHASRKYLRPNLEFLCGPADAIPVPGTQVFDCVVSFGTIEHLDADQQAAFLGEVGRLLKPKGLFLASTPNKLFYSDLRGQQDASHRHELYYDDYLDLLKRCFRHVHILGQRVYPVSYLWQLTDLRQPVSEHQIAFSADTFGPVSEDKKEALYMVAVCSNGPISVPGGSVLLDISDQRSRGFRERLIQAANAMQATQASLASEKAGRQELADLRRALEEQLQQLRQRCQQLTAERETATHEAAELRRTLNNNQEYVRALVAEAKTARSEAAESRVRADDTTQDCEASRREAASLLRTVSEQEERLRTLAAEAEAAQCQLGTLRQAFEDQIDGLRKEKDALRGEAVELQTALGKQRAHAGALSAETDAVRREATQLATAKEAARREAGQWQLHAQRLMELNEALQNEATGLRQTLRGYEEQVGALTARIESLTEREKELHEMLLTAHDQLLRRDEEAQRATTEIWDAFKQPIEEIGTLTAELNAARSAFAEWHQDVQQLAGGTASPEGERTEFWQTLTKYKEHVDWLASHVESLMEQANGCIAFPPEPAAALAILPGEAGTSGGPDLTEADGISEPAEPTPPTGNDAPLHHGPEEVGLAPSQPANEDEQHVAQMGNLIRELVNRHVPSEATVLVLGEGCEEFLRLDGRQARHFPQAPDGSHAGYPEDDAAAIAHLEEQRAHGASYLLVPYCAQPWLDSHGGFRHHLEQHSRVVLHHTLPVDEVVCTIYTLNPLAKQSPAHATPLGINILGRLSPEKCAGEAVESLIRSLDAVRVPYVLNESTEAGSAGQGSVRTESAINALFPINLICLDADAIAGVVRTKADRSFRGHYRIASWACERLPFPNDWDANLQGFDEIWVSSNSVLDAVARVSPVPVVRIPYSLGEQLAVKPWTPAHFGLPQGTFLFLHILDSHSIMECKHPLGVIEAFRRAFSSRDDVLLVLHCSHATPAQLQAVQEAAAGSYIRVIDTVLSRDEVNALLQLADCYVSLHRLEGFGLPMAKAMSVSKPVIATGYSGNMDYMSPANSFLVKYDLSELDRDYPPYKPGSAWADPSLDHAAELMRLVYENRALAQEVGQKARADIVRHFHPQVVGRLIQERLLKLKGSGTIPVGPRPRNRGVPVNRGAF